MKTLYIIDLFRYETLVSKPIILGEESISQKIEVLARDKLVTEKELAAMGKTYAIANPHSQPIAASPYFYTSNSYRIYPPYKLTYVMQLKAVNRKPPKLVDHLAAMHILGIKK